MGLVTVKPASLKYLIDNGSRKAREIYNMRQNLEASLSTIQVGITIVAIISGTMAERLTANYGVRAFSQLGLSATWAEHASIVTFILILTYGTVVLGELVPKSLAAKYPSRVTFLFYNLMAIAKVGFRPFVKIFEVSTKFVIRVIDRVGPQLNPSALEAADDAFAIHRLSQKHREYVLNLIKLQKQPMSQVLLSWDEVVTVDKSMSRQHVLKILVQSGHTRVPVFDGENVVGLINAKELFAKKADDWRSHIHPIIKVNECTRPLTALRLMQKKHSHMCLVESKDFQQPLGISTIENILEEIFGEIYDEDDDPVFDH